uniref:MMS19 nucleotide excision repair protein n=1 Tax=Globisporangium ultimum (strain ATCC 200006 / CBS 805.95 / DAOM BR144) TaxID=431595 RepID=K3WEQ0_GLOUD
MFSLDAPLAPAIDAFVNPENDDNVHKTSLNTVVMQVHRKVSMEALIQALGLHLTSTDDKVRARAMQLLAEVLSRLPELPLTPNAVQLLVDFFADRLADYPSASACLQALLALESNHAKKIASPTVTIILIQKMVKVLHVPQLGQAMRKQCFELMQLALGQKVVVDVLVTAPESSSIDHGLLFAQAFLNAMEGEKDPRNLLLCLQIARELLAKLEVVFDRHDAVLQQYFDVVSCYFPITFTPPPNDPYGITSEELILSLRKAFAASDLLAKHVLPFLLEKLSSTVVEAKLDSLQTLVFCCEAYSINVALLHMLSIANALYHEVVKGEKKEVIEASLRAISRFSSVIGLAKTKAAGGAAYAWNKFVVELTTRAMSDLTGHATDSLVSVSAGQVLAALGKDSVLGFTHVLETSVPLLIQQFNESSTSTESKCEASLARLLLIVNTIDREVDQSASAQPMRPHALVLIDALVAFLSNNEALSTPTAKCSAIEALSHLVTYPPSPIVEIAQVKALVELFINFLLFDASPEVRRECLQSLRAISTIKQKATVKNYASLVMEIALTQLMDAVQLSAQNTKVAAVLASSGRDHPEFFNDVLDSITQLSQEASLFQATIVRLVDFCVVENQDSNKITFVANSSANGTQAHVDGILNAVAKIVELNADDKASMEFCVTSGGDNSIVFRLLKAVTTTAADAAAQNALLDDAKLASCARIFRTPMQNVSTETQQLLANAAISAFLTTQSTGASASHPAYLQLVPLFSAVINSANRNLNLPETSRVINTLLELAQSSTAVYHTTASTQQIEQISSEAALSAAKSLASIVNKMSDGEEFDALIVLLLDQKLSQIIANEQKDVSVRVAALQIYVWIAKALVIRGHREHAPACLFFLCKFLTPETSDARSQIAMHVAKSFKLLVTEFPDVLNRKCGAFITFLYRQRTFDLVYPVLLEYIRSHSGVENVEALVAFSHVISNSPKAIYLPHMGSIFPLMVQAINSDEKELGSPAIKTFKSLLFESVESVKPFLKDVFPGLLKQAQHGASALDRHDALDCLAKLATIPYELIHPYKDMVLRQLLHCLNDRKRFVRHAAVRVRNQWSVL